MYKKKGIKAREVGRVSFERKLKEAQEGRYKAKETCKGGKDTKKENFERQLKLAQAGMYYTKGGRI